MVDDISAETAKLEYWVTVACFEVEVKYITQIASEPTQEGSDIDISTRELSGVQGLTDHWSSAVKFIIQNFILQVNLTLTDNHRASVSVYM